MRRAGGGKLKIPLLSYVKYKHFTTLTAESMPQVASISTSTSKEEKMFHALSFTCTYPAAQHLAVKTSYSTICTYTVHS